jgi:hypothetical protein
LQFATLFDNDGGCKAATCNSAWQQWLMQRYNSRHYLIMMAGSVTTQRWRVVLQLTALLANDGERHCNSLLYLSMMAGGTTWQWWWATLLGNNGEQCYAANFFFFFKFIQQLQESSTTYSFVFARERKKKRKWEKEKKKELWNLLQDTSPPI